ncbi:MAG: DUF3341 domain-containing protein [Candidatus Marinimicrobia bacterium]|jgi:hypothetical protein|nr:DUF3341 domain-containing protein [Candidatus Neomarinimicrobiota bacterium]MBT4383195.1 DUF3341 domain-containing protein [Candidatus Neomarinimicrobiota bacterium]MBT4636012.1 DUF3341 domain-containing protein [Candidatus Neomarinimicrobiota bacterium]MBT4686014.1 DUF3341 domain-containing protein [Candidatus Neomarinimicrobiota bacterium]MBT4734838.1 DUF3341 domain-containing protein [Candidatus Neomarinimicrobiota bacterium]
MKIYFVVSFDNEYDLVGATQDFRNNGFNILDAYTPYAVHGLDKAMGLKPSRLSKICFGFAFIGLTIGLYGQYWISAVNWPINIGGKPWNSMPGFLPIAFETTVLFAGLGTVFTLLWRTGILPGRKPKVYAPAVTDDVFALVITEETNTFDSEKAENISTKYHSIEWHEKLESE